MITMVKNDIKEQLRESENIIIQQINNFQALFMAVSELNAIILKNPENADIETIKTLEIVLQTDKHLKQSKAFFLYRATAITIITIIKNTSNKKIVDKCLSVLKNNIRTSSKNRLRAVAEATGTLPLKIFAKRTTPFDISIIPSMSFNEILTKQKIKTCTDHKWLGRSLVSNIDENKILVLKMAKQDDNLSELNMENGFMNYILKEFSTELKFKIPAPLKFSDHFLFSINELPISAPDNMNLHERNICIAFIADRDYFIYPNEENNDFFIDEAIFQEMILRNSSLLGELSGDGLIHTAPVPLFHNRVQQERREDGGIYDWAKGGRLDKWLESCRFPNFGESGLRDFEHFEIYNGNSLKLYKHIGSHILSLIMVTGSFFRNIGKDNCNKTLVGKFGFDDNGIGINAKELFNKQLLEQSLESILKNYYKSFTGIKDLNNFPFNFEKLSKTIIDEMGEDKHMEEILRVADQKKMSENEFSNFLLEKGFSLNKVTQLNKGEKDTTTPTGPHLGGFNQKISIPCLTDLLAKFSASCIADKFDAPGGKVTAP